MSYHHEPYGTFTGTETDVPEPTAPDLTPPFTVSLWFRTSFDYFNDSPLGFGYMLHKGSFSGGTINFGMIISSDFDPPNHMAEIIFSQGPSSAWAAGAGSGLGNGPFVNIIDGQWHLLTGTYDGTNLRIYLDAFLDHTEPTGGATPPTNNNDMDIGGGGTVPFMGDLDEIRIWNVALTQQEISDYYNNGTVPQQSNIVYENLFGGSGGSTSGIAPTDIGMFLTGGSTNIDPNLSLGGNISTTEVVSDNLHNLFRRITDSEASSGTTIYRCVAIKNKSATDTMLNCIFYMVSDTVSPDDQSLYSNSVAIKNTPETAISNEFNEPGGTNFIATLNRSGGISLGDLAPGEYKNVWMRVTVNPGAQQFPDNKFKVRVEVNGTASSEPPEPDPDPETGISFTMAAIGDMSCNSNFNTNWSRIKARNTGFVLFNGDDAYSSGSNCWIDAVGSTWLAKSITSFGNHDVDESESQPSTKNNLINAFPALQGKTYTKLTFNNVGVVIMESGENQSVSDSVGSAQYNFVKAALEEFKANPSIEWIIVCNHYPLYGPASDHSNNSGGRDRYDPLFDTNGVDVVFTSHNHNLWHTKLIKYNSGSPSSPTAIGTDPNYSYNKSSANHGKIYIGTGAGGRSHYDIDSSPSYVVYSNDTSYGYVFMEFSSSPKKITFKIYSSSDTLLKTFSLTHT